jgi:PBP1b-binding outer membrane lipoprotein LpoB
MFRTTIWIALFLLFIAACTTNAPPAGTVSENSAPQITPRETATQVSAVTPTLTEMPPTSTPIPSPTANQTQKNTAETTPENINPLTGLQVDDPTLLDRRPIAVKVQIFPRGQRPPWGISLADIVYDYYQNNGVTRLTAIFYGNDAEQVGPIRSARLFDADIIKTYRTIFVFGLADWRIYQHLNRSSFANRLVVEKYGICPPLCRIDPEGYNHLVVDTAELTEYADENGIPNERQKLDGMRFDPTPPVNGESAEHIFVRISYSAYNSWDYDPISKKYLRSQDTIEALPGEEQFEPLIDQLTGEQISADNVVVLLLPHKFAYQTQAGKGELFNIGFTGNGEAFAFRDGLKYHLHWKRSDNHAPLELAFPDGTVYAYKPGNTWYQLIGKTSKVENLEDGTSRFEFNVP